LPRQGGEYFAFGKTGAAARPWRRSVVIIDDPHSEQSVINSAKLDFESTRKWYLAGPRQQLQPNAWIWFS